jgi:hypothetical protein
MSEMNPFDPLPSVADDGGTGVYSCPTCAAGYGSYQSYAEHRLTHVQTPQQAPAENPAAALGNLEGGAWGGDGGGGY